MSTRNEPHKTLGSQIMQLFESKLTNSSSYSFQTHQVNYIYELDKKKSMVPNIIINKKYNQDNSTILSMPFNNTIQFEKEDVFAKPEVMSTLDDIFNIKLKGKYKNNISDYVVNEEKHLLGGKKEQSDSVEVKLFDDDDDDDNSEIKESAGESSEVKIKLFNDLDDDDVPFMDQFKEREIQKEKTGKKRKRMEKKYTFLEDSDDDEENHDKSIALNSEDESEDEDLLKNKAAETHNFINSTKVKSDNKPNKLAKRNKEKKEWKQIQTLMKEKDEEKQKGSKDSSDL